MDKKKILLVNESSASVHSGFANIGKGLLTRLWNTGKFEIAELGTYCKTSDASNLSVPWEVYGSVPEDNDIRGQQLYNSDVEGQFGKLIFEKVLLDFKPQYVISFVDFWMLSFIEKSPFRKYFKLILMPCVDSEPQQQEWLETYKKADINIGFSEYAKKILEEESGGEIKIFDIAAPGVDHEIFHPMDRISCRKELGLDPSCNIILNISRNQERKRLPELLESFAKYLHDCNLISNKEKTYLWLNTSLVDVGFDLGKHILRLGIGHRVLFTYVCQRCRYFWPDHHQTELTVCPKCNTLAAHTPSTSSGISREELVKIYNCADVYVQYAVAGALEMPLAEAKSCSIPIITTRYAAMQNQAENITGCNTISINQYYWESDFKQTGQRRVYSDNNHLVILLHQFFNTPKEVRESWREAIRQDVLDKYTYDRSAKVFEKAIDSLEPYDENLTWDYPKSRLCPMNQDIPRFNSNIDFINWCCFNILGDKSRIGSYWAAELIKSLNIGYNTVNGGRQKFTHEDCFKMFMEMAAKINYWEKQRVRLVQKEIDTFRWELV